MVTGWDCGGGGGGGGGGTESPPHQLQDLGEYCKHPQQGPGQTLMQTGSWTVFGLQMTNGSHNFDFIPTDFVL